MAKREQPKERLPRHEARIVYAKSPDIDQDIQISALGLHEEMPPSMIHRPEGSGDYLLMAFHHPAVVEVAGAELAVAAGSMVVWDPAATHRYGNAEARWSHTWLHCGGSFVVDQVILSGLVPGVPFAGPAVEFADRVRDLHREIRDQPRCDPAVVRAHLGLVFRHVARALHGASAGAAIPPELLAVRRHLEEHLAEPLRLPGLARLAGWSVPHFCAQFRRHFATSAIDLLIDLRLHHARLLLTDRNLTVEAVAQRVGYADYRQFSKLFRKRFGTAPRLQRG